jgi:hypothetical protein
MVVGGAALRSTSLITGHADGSAIRDETRTIRRASTQKPDWNSRRAETIEKAAMAASATAYHWMVSISERSW